MLLTMALGGFYSGRGKTRVVMYVDFLLAAVNIGLDPLLIFGLGPFPPGDCRGGPVDRYRLYDGGPGLCRALIS